MNGPTGAPGRATSSGLRSWKRRANCSPNCPRRSAPHRCRCRKAKAMSCHSEEMWESFDALWRRVQELSRQVRELEARLGAVESERQTPEVIANDKRARTIYESEVGR